MLVSIVLLITASAGLKFVYNQAISTLVSRMPDNYNQEDFDQWDEDKVDLSFRTVADLHHLLTSRDLNLDFQLFRQSHEINQMLIKVLKIET